MGPQKNRVQNMGRKEIGWEKIGSGLFFVIQKEKTWPGLASSCLNCKLQYGPQNLKKLGLMQPYIF